MNKRRVGRLGVAVGVPCVAALVVIVAIRVSGGIAPDAALCDGGVAAPEPDAAPASVSDCAILLDALATFAGTARLDWSASRPVSTWQGVIRRDGRVTEIRLDFTGLSGRIPPGLGNLSRLEEIHLSGNRLTGKIPPELGNLSQLDELDLSQNRLTGSVPAELGNLRRLDELDLSQNRLTGSIPAELGSLLRLERLDLSGNQLTGSIPRELGDPLELEEVSLSSNQLTGSIPAALGQLAYLGILDLSSNDLAGSIPTELAAGGLRVLDLSFNELTGSIPGGWRNLRDVWLRGNNLTGCVPFDVPPIIFRRESQNDLDQLGLPDCAR